MWNTSPTFLALESWVYELVQSDLRTQLVTTKLYFLPSVSALLGFWRQKGMGVASICARAKLTWKERRGGFSQVPDGRSFIVLAAACARCWSSVSAPAVAVCAAVFRSLWDLSRAFRTISRCVYVETCSEQLVCNPGFLLDSPGGLLKCTDAGLSRERWAFINFHKKSTSLILMPGRWRNHCFKMFFLVLFVKLLFCSWN